MKTEYYFKFVVSSHYEKEFNTYKQAVKSAIEEGETSVFITIYSKKNYYKEPYDDIALSLHEPNRVILECKKTLVKSFNKLTNHEKIT